MQNTACLIIPPLPRSHEGSWKPHQNPRSVRLFRKDVQMIHRQCADRELLDAGFQDPQALHCHETHRQCADRRRPKSGRADGQCAHRRDAYLCFAYHALRLQLNLSLKALTVSAVSATTQTSRVADSRCPGTSRFRLWRVLTSAGVCPCMRQTSAPNLTPTGSSVCAFLYGQVQGCHDALLYNYNYLFRSSQTFTPCVRRR